MLEHWVMGVLFVAGFFSVGWLLLEHHRRLRLSHVELMAEINAVGANIVTRLEELEAASSRNLEATMEANALIDDVDTGLAAYFNEIKRDLTTLIEDRPKLMQIPQVASYPSAPPLPSPGDRVVTWNDLRRAGEAKRQRDLAATLAVARQEAQRKAPPVMPDAEDWKYIDEAEPVPGTAWQDVPATPAAWLAGVTERLEKQGTRRTSAMDQIFKQAKENE